MLTLLLVCSYRLRLSNEGLDGMSFVESIHRHADDGVGSTLLAGYLF